ncbi:hypothetical protein ACMFMG_004504 [Clarireedia jacksonii]
MKELEARLAQVETQLVAETKQMAANSSAAEPNVSPGWNAMNMDMDINCNDGELQNLVFDMLQGNMGGIGAEPNVPIGDYFSQEIVSLGLQEPLPPDSLMSELYRIYFERYHATMPIIHKPRFYASLDLPIHLKPQVSLRYAMMLLAASHSDSYRNYAGIFYERARRYAELAEMKGRGESFVNIQFLQTWILIANYEATNAYFTRAWMSTGRCARLCHMLGLGKIDQEGGFTGKRLLNPAKDWIELEERRRAFWASFYADRWASSATGWQMMFDDKTIETNMPASDEAYELGIEQEMNSLADAMTPDGAAKITSFGSIVLAACLFGHNTDHMFKRGPNERPDDLANGEFWKRHRRIDNVLSSTFMFLPDHLRLPFGIRDMNVVFFHMNIHTSTICLHQGAILTAQKHGINKAFIRQSEARCLMAAEEVANIMRLISHLDSSKMSSWTGFCLYVAGGVFLHDIRKPNPNPQSTSNLDFILSVMKAFGNRHSVTQHFSAQLEFDIENSNLEPSKMTSHVYKSYEKVFATLDDHDLCSFSMTRMNKPEHSKNASGNENGAPANETIPVSLAGVLPAQTSSGLYDNHAQTHYPNVVSNHRSQPDSGSDTFDTDFSFAMGNTPSSDSSASVQNAAGTNTYAYRTPKPNEMDGFGTGDNAWAFETGFLGGDLGLGGNGLSAVDGGMGLMNEVDSTGYRFGGTDGGAEGAGAGAGAGVGVGAGVGGEGVRMSEENPPENELLNSLLNSTPLWEGGIVSLGSRGSVPRC